MSRISKLVFGAAGVLAAATMLWALAMQGGSTPANASPVGTGTAGTGTASSGTRTVVATGTVAATGTVESSTQTPEATPTQPASTPTRPPATPTRPASTPTQPAGGEGCTPGFWKTHTDTSRNPNAWPPTGLTPSQRVDSVFTIPAEFSALADDSLLTALGYTGGSTDQEAAQILLRAAVAAVLNADHPDIDYPLSASSIISQVNAALATSDRGTILSLKDTLDADNNLGCSISGH